MSMPKLVGDGRLATTRIGSGPLSTELHRQLKRAGWTCHIPQWSGLVQSVQLSQA
jgi:hypothetical protein